jgi:hypothetical protein
MITKAAGRDSASGLEGLQRGWTTLVENPVRPITKRFRSGKLGVFAGRLHRRRYRQRPGHAKYLDRRSHLLSTLASLVGISPVRITNLRCLAE